MFYGLNQKYFLEIIMSADQQQLEYIEKKLFKKANKLRLKLPEAYQASNQAKIRKIKEVKALHNLVVNNPAFDLFREEKSNKKIIEKLESLGGIRQAIRSGMKSKGVPVDADSPEASSALAPATISPAAEASSSAAASTGGAGSKRKRSRGAGASAAESAEPAEQQEALSELEGLFCGKVCTAFWMLPAADARGMRSRKKPKRLSPHEDSRERGAAATTYNETRETREITDDDLVISHG